MPTLLRLAIAAIAMVGLTTSPLALILSGPDDVGGVSTVVSVVALCALWCTPTIAGTLVSAWSTGDADSTRRVRRIVAICAGVTVLGAVAFVVTAAVAGDAVWIALLIAAVALATFPASIALGAAARRADLRRNPPATDADEELAAVDADVRRGRRRGVIGAGIGLVVALVGDVLIGLLVAGERDTALALIGFAVAVAVIGASTGRLTVVFRLAQRSRDLLGSDYGVARRTGRIVRGKQQAASPEEEELAARYARIAVRTVPFQSRSSLLTMVVVVLVVILPLQAVQVGRIRRFAEAHPVAAERAPSA